MLQKNLPEESIHRLSIFVRACSVFVHEVKDCERTAGFKFSIRDIDARVGEEGGHVSVRL